MVDIDLNFLLKELIVSIKNDSFLPTFNHAYAAVDGLRVHYVAAGEGMPILLLPGWLQTWYACRDLILPLAEHGFRVIAADLRGMGHSDWPSSGYDTGQLAKDMNALMNRLGYSRYAVVGHDVGMWVGYAMAADYPDAVERIVLMEGGIPGLVSPSAEVFMPQAESAYFWQFMFNQQPDLPEFLLQGRERAFMKYLFERWSFRPDRIALEQYAETYAAPGGIRTQMNYYRAFPATIAQNIERAKKPLAMPVLGLGGDHGVRDLPERMLSSITKNLKSAVLLDCGHFAPEESPEQVLEHLLPFLIPALK